MIFLITCVLKCNLNYILKSLPVNNIVLSSLCHFPEMLIWEGRTTWLSALQCDLVPTARSSQAKAPYPVSVTS
jgi:hypothetical protein